MAEPHTIYNCETCMFLTRNKKDYARHLKSRKHLENHPMVATTTDTTDATCMSCAKCNKEFKSRTAMYIHTKKCNSGVAPSPAQYDDPASFTLEQIQYILMENKILKELLVNAIQGHHQAAAYHSV